MSVSVMVTCEGHRPDGPCRGHLPIKLAQRGQFSTYTFESIAVEAHDWRFKTVDGHSRLLCASRGHLEEP